MKSPVARIQIAGWQESNRPGPGIKSLACSNEIARGKDSNRWLAGIKSPVASRAIHECTRELTRTRTCEYFNSKSGTRTRANLFPRVTCTRELSTHELQVHPPSLYQKWQ